MKLALLALLGSAAAIKTHHKSAHKKAHKVPSLAQVFGKHAQTEEEMQEFFNYVDDDGDGEITMEELIDFINEAIAPDTVPDEALPEIQAEFDKVDTNGSGGIDFAEAMAAFEASQWDPTQ